MNVNKPFFAQANYCINLCPLKNVCLYPFEYRTRLRISRWDALIGTFWAAYSPFLQLSARLGPLLELFILQNLRVSIDNNKREATVE